MKIKVILIIILFIFPVLLKAADTPKEAEIWKLVKLEAPSSVRFEQTGGFTYYVTFKNMSGSPKQLDLNTSVKLKGKLLTGYEGEYNCTKNEPVEGGDEIKISCTFKFMWINDALQNAGEWKLSVKYGNNSKQVTIRNEAEH